MLYIWKAERFVSNKVISKLASLLLKGQDPKQTIVNMGYSVGMLYDLR